MPSRGILTAASVLQPRVKPWRTPRHQKEKFPKPYTSQSPAAPIEQNLYFMLSDRCLLNFTSSLLLHVQHLYSRASCPWDKVGHSLPWNIRALQTAQKLCNSQAQAPSSSFWGQGTAFMVRHPQHGDVRGTGRPWPRSAHLCRQQLLLKAAQTHTSGLGDEPEGSLELLPPAAQHGTALLKPPTESWQANEEATSVVTSVLPTELLTKVFKTFLKEEDRKAESSLGDSRGNALVSSSTAASCGFSDTLQNMDNTHILPESGPRTATEHGRNAASHVWQKSKCT